VAREKLVACTNCGMAPMKRALAVAKLRALVQGAEQASRRVARD
jgi:5-methyltetrahydropteroyltriglutamate--homocysteine methyltransferase